MISKVKQDYMFPLGMLFTRKSVIKTLNFFIINRDRDYSISEVQSATKMTRQTLDYSIPVLLKFKVLQSTRVVGNTQMYAYNHKAVICLDINNLVGHLFDKLNTIENTEQKEV